MHHCEVLNDVVDKRIGGSSQEEIQAKSVCKCKIYIVSDCFVGEPDGKSKKRHKCCAVEDLDQMDGHLVVFLIAEGNSSVVCDKRCKQSSIERIRDQKQPITSRLSDKQREI